MRNFKIGDRIKVIKLLDDCKEANIGDIGIVEDITDDAFPIRVTINNTYDYGFKEDEIELYDILNKELNELDQALINLAKCDSGIEYAPHMREPFNEIINKLNSLKCKIKYNDLQKKNEYYFEDEE